MWRTTTTSLLLLLVTTGVVRGATDGTGQPRARQYTLPSLYSSSSPQQLSQYPGDLQYDLSALSSPQLQYPGVGPQPSLHGYPPAFYPGNPNARIPSQQPGAGPVLIYPSSVGGGGQPFLLGGGGGLPPPGNFLIPQQPPQQPPPLGPGLDPGLIYRDAPPYHPHQRPVFVAGYPKPAHIPPPPPIEKDAEEVPASVDRGSGPPAQGAQPLPPQGAGVPRLPPPPQGKKPQKIETFDEPIRPEKPSDEQPIPKKPTRQRPKLNPGQRFFILNGQPLFSNYPISPFFNPYHQQQQGGIPDFYKNQQQQPQFPPGFGLFGKPQQHQEYPIQSQYPAYDTNQNAFKQNIFFKNGLPLGLLKQIRANQLNNRVHPQSSSNNDNNGDGPLQSREYDQQQRQRHPAQQQQQQLQQLQQQQQQQYDNLELEELDEALQFDRQRQSPYNDGQINPGVAAYDYFRYQAPAVPVKLPLKVTDAGDEDDDDDKDSVEIVAKVQDDKDEDSESEDVVAAVSSEKPPVEASIAQAQPGAIALAGVGGVAAAGPRGTALAGEGGLAVASPQATAVAGPRNDDEDVSNNKRKPAKKISKQ